VIAHEKEYPDEILLGINKDNPQLHDVYHLDLESGELEKLFDNPGVVGWVADTDLKVRAAMRPLADGGSELLARRPGAGADEWSVVLQVDSDDSLGTGPVAFTADGVRLYVLTSKDANASRLVLVDLSTGWGSVLAEHEQYDVGGVILHPDSRELQMVTFVMDKSEHVIVDPMIQADIDGIRAIQSGDFTLAGRDHADRTWLVAFTVDDGPVTYYAWDREAKKSTRLFDHQPALNDYRLSPMEPFQFKSRDGLDVHGYATFPVGAEAKLPAVINVHGGPWARDLWGFSPEAQWLANRGYLCVQVNFRGSTGYGKQFLNAGNKEWAGKMHDDLLDAVDFICRQGWADRDRIAIMGGSYGGYAALVGATFTPDVFRCAVDVVGPSNLKTLIESIPPYWAPIVSQFHMRVGNPETEEEFLWSRSPLSRVDQITIPILVAQGANDPRVKQAEAEQIVAAMKDKGIDHEYLLYPDEGHGFARPENRMHYYAAAERFLARHLGGRYEE
jgi:dipeptidyl aminopeptidase/acylaminoacyl peptidase